MQIRHAQLFVSSHQLTCSTYWSSLIYSLPHYGHFREYFISLPTVYCYEKRIVFTICV